MNYNLNATLGTKSLNKLVKDLENYRDVILQDKLEKYVDLMADKGIAVARLHTGWMHDLGNVSGLISLTKEVDAELYGYSAVMYMSDISTITQSWVRFGTQIDEEVSPSLMAEFGSGNYAIEGHRGTFPGQTHALEPSWSWQTLDGQWESSSGIRPTRPMFNAMEELYKVAIETAKEVFG